MKPHEKLCTLLSVVLLLLPGCRPVDGAAASTSPAAPASPSQEQKDDGFSAAPEASGQPSAEPAPEPDLWEPEHTLEFRFTPAQGLELPAAGATGYASVKLPLWEQLPKGDEGKLAAVYAPPEPSPEPVPDPSEPSGLPSPEPVEEPEESAGIKDSPQAGEAEPGEAEESPDPEQSAGSGPAGPEPSGEPSAGPTAEPSPEPAPESAQIPEAVPDPESTPALEAAPEPEPTPEPASAPDPLADALMVLEPGTAFLILGESGDWWQVRCQDTTGWIEHRYCLINLPDVIPSMIYDGTNAYSSVFASSGKDIPNVTGKTLYQAADQNPRLGRREFIMPVLYSTAKNVCQAQQNALAEGNTLVLYEGFRPNETQMAVVRSLTALSKRDEAVRVGISTKPWNISWFIATGPSNHQEGYAIDVSLAKVTKAHMGRIGNYSVVQVDEYEEYVMPTPIHELSMAAATFTQPVAIFSTTAWRSAALAPAMAASGPALALQRYCTSAKLTPLASEWWHFNDLAAYGQIRAYPSGGNYQITECLSVAPQ